MKRGKYYSHNQKYIFFLNICCGHRTCFLEGKEMCKLKFLSDVTPTSSSFNSCRSFDNYYKGIEFLPQTLIL